MPKSLLRAPLQQRVRAVLHDLQDAYAEMPPWIADLHEAAHARQPVRLLQLVMSLDRGLEAPGQMRLRGFWDKGQGTRDKGLFLRVGPWVADPWW